MFMCWHQCQMGRMLALTDDVTKNSINVCEKIISFVMFSLMPKSYLARHYSNSIECHIIWLMKIIWRKYDDSIELISMVFNGYLNELESDSVILVLIDLQSCFPISDDELYVFSKLCKLH